MTVFPTSEDATTIINAAAVEVGLTPVTDPYSSSNAAFVELRNMLNTAGREISRMFDWQTILKDGTITITSTDDGDYDIPTDYLSMVANTAWDTTNRRPVMGPVTAKDWAFLTARDIASINYWYFRIQGNKFKFYPNNPVGANAAIIYQYKSAYWVLKSDNTTYQKTVMTGTDKPLFDSLLMSRYLKLKWLQAKQFDTTDAQNDFNEQFTLLTGADVPGYVLDASGVSPHLYLDAYNNVLDTGYGS